jgi:DNA-binding transcriptional LysR family regulator
MIVDPISLKLYVAIVEEGTIAAAAEREHIAASAVSKRIGDLEDALQTQLLRRTNRGLCRLRRELRLLNLARGVLHDLNDIFLQIGEFPAGSAVASGCGQISPPSTSFCRTSSNPS